MTRRTRRDLSNRKIRRIVRNQISASQGQLSLTANSANNILFRRVIPLILLIFIMFWGYSQLKESEFLKFDSDAEYMDGNAEPLDDQSNQADLQTEGKSVADNLQSTNSAPAEVTEEKQPAIEPVQRNLQVEVLNGCGAGGIASRVTQYLRREKVDVVNIGNHSNFNVKKTVLWKRTDKAEAAPKIAELLGVSSDRIDSKIDPNLQLDVTIILGSDYKSLKPFK